MEPTNKTIRSDNNLLFQSADALPQLPILPQELIKTLFSELSSNDLQDAASATLIWNFETIEYVKQQRDNSFKTLINWLIVQIDSKVYANQLIALKTKLKESAILDSANLWDVKSSTVDFEMCLITILKSLSNDDLIELGKNFQEKKY